MRKALRFLLLALPALTLSGFITLQCLQAKEYKPIIGQRGKDVIWVPTPDEVTEAMLEIAGVTSSDYVVDLGSGDGRIVIAAARKGAKAMGIEFNPDMVALSERNAEKAGVSDRTVFVEGDFFEKDFSNASVVTMYLLPDVNLKLRPKLLGMTPGTRIVSQSFAIGDWEPDRTISRNGRSIFLWIVPARIEGIWIWKEDSARATLSLEQKYQYFEGTLNIEGNELPILNPKLLGDRISFTCGDRNYSGRVFPEAIRGEIVSGTKKLGWTAHRKGRTE